MEETYTSPDDFDHIPNFLGKMHIICNNKTKTKTKKKRTPRNLGSDA